MALIPSSSPVRVIEVAHVIPCSDSSESATQLSLPLTFFDTLWFKFHPVDRIYFYELTESSSTPAFFHSVILPRLKHSLSLTLSHFLPIAGSVTWPSHASKPLVLYTPGDGVALTVAESDADFLRLSGDHVREAAELYPYVPELPVSDSAASVIALQITFFPNQGFCIGVSAHHAILDGQSSVMFLKAWAHICKRKEEEADRELTPSNLPPELTPYLDRTVIQDPEDIATVYLNDWSEIQKLLAPADSNPKSVKLLPIILGADSAFNTVRATLELSREDIKRIRERIISELDNKLQREDKTTTSHTKPLPLSTFVVVYAYVSVSIIRAKELASNRQVFIGFSADCRARLEPPVPANYFGNCVMTSVVVTKPETIVEENGLVFVAEELSEKISRLEKGVLEGAKQKLTGFTTVRLDEIEVIGVAGSNRLEVYGTDFGWGRPKKVEVTSIDRTGSISLAESRDGSGGVEIGLVLEKHQMERFQALFWSGLN